ncbi:MAG: alpha/beta hydrolase family protein [Archangium sp.]
MHWLDSLSIRWLKRTPIFSKGWGSLDEVEAFAQTLRTPSPGKPLSITWGPIHRDTSLSVQDGTAISPAQILPSSLRTMHVRRVLTPLAAKKRLIVPPSWGDAGYGPRMFLAGALVARGIEVWLLEGAYFGKREAKLDTVEDFFRMGLGHIDEVRSILETHQQGGLATSVAGYSMAGQLGSMAVQSVPYEVPVVAMACAPSPDTVFVDGPLTSQVQWNALGGDRERLRAAMRHVSALDQPPPKSQKRLVALNTKDGIVAPDATRKMAAHWGVEPVELSTGHVGAYALNRRKLQDLIARTILD